MHQFTRLAPALTLLACLAAIGCGDSGVPRNDLEGTVTFKDSPVPYGRISFRPDSSKGNKGPAGIAVIREGKFSTADSGKGAVSGPLLVTIEGLKSNQPLAMPLFTPYKTEAEVTSDTESLDFTIPAESAFNPQKKRSRRGR